MSKQEEYLVVDCPCSWTSHTECSFTKLLSCPWCYKSLRAIQRV